MKKHMQQQGIKNHAIKMRRHQHFPRGENYTLRDGKLTPIKNLLAPLEGPGILYILYMQR